MKDLISYSLVFGAALFVAFGFLSLCRPREPHEDDYSYYMGKLSNMMWPIGVAIMVISAILWLVS